jgi:uncharacterized protein YqeY
MKKEIQDQVKVALKAGNKLEVQTLRALLAAFQYEEMQKSKDELESTEATAILKNEIKKRRESIEFAEKAGRADQTDALSAEILILEKFLPQQFSAEKIEQLLVEIKAANPSWNMGQAMKQLKDLYPGQYDGKLASDTAKKVFV